MKFSQTEMDALLDAEIEAQKAADTALTTGEKRGLVGLALAGLAGASQAAVDVTAITAAGTDIAAVGAAVFAVFVGIKLYKWIRRAL